MNSPIDKYIKILREYWGYEDFRDIQRDIIESIGSGRDTLGLMPTGGGKSLTFQVPALATEGVCIVITPLIALMKDQIMHLRRLGIQATAIYSGMSRQEIIKALENCIFGGVKLLYISPERLGSELFQAKLKHIRISFITVDEAHCISQWGYDFRPAYLNISVIRRLKPGIPILALTATATPEVVDDIQTQLGFTEKNVFRMSFERKNLTYVVRHTENKEAELIHILTLVSGSAIVYVRSRRKTKEIAQLLETHQISATFYHAGLDHAVKDNRQKDWQADHIRVIVATNAFGMGIDKPDVRTVVHIDCPDSIEAYFQEAGRAGRDGRKAYAVLLHSNNDTSKLDRRVADNFPEKDYIKKVYEHLAYYYQIGAGSGNGYTSEFDIDKFCHTFKHFPIQANAALHILERAGYIHYETDPDAAARVMFLLDRNELYRLNETNPNEEAVITSLLRTYGGLFNDYVYINEELMAQRAGLTEQQVYLNLKALSRRRILHFVPRRKMPFITYTQDREETARIHIPQAVYEERKEQLVRRILAMKQYITDNNTCRSRQLLHYFGEQHTKDCTQCDVCLNHRTNRSSANLPEQIRQEILTLLSDHLPHSIAELKTLRHSPHLLNDALRYLINEELILFEDETIRLTK